jgi:hypothetical protein
LKRFRGRSSDGDKFDRRVQDHWPVGHAVGVETRNRNMRNGRSAVAWVYLCKDIDDAIARAEEVNRGDSPDLGVRMYKGEPGKENYDARLVPVEIYEEQDPDVEVKVDRDAAEQFRQDLAAVDEQFAPGTAERDRRRKEVIDAYRRGEKRPVDRSAATDTVEVDGSEPTDAVEVDTVAVDAVPPAAVNAERSDFERAASGTAFYKEAQLVSRFQTFLESHGHTVERYRITTPAGVLYTDVADTSNAVLYEAKADADRVSVRLALGQLLDYGRYVQGTELAVLLPGMPSADLIELLKNYLIGCVVESGPGQFTDATGLRRCP